MLVELGQQKLLRAVYSERQLQEVLTDFWFNHFNVDARKGARPLPAHRVRARRDPPARARQVPRPARRDGEEPGDALLSRQLDERRSERTASGRRAGRPRIGRGRFGGRIGRAAAACDSAAERKNAPKGLNENYGRELMELHTLGVDGGYTQKDVTEVARAFTGWTIRQPAAGRRLRVRRRASTTRARRSCSATSSRRAAASATASRCSTSSRAHPSTARFIATKLARRFVSDTPPPALVDRAAARFRETDGDLREVMRTILTSPEFLVARRVPREGQDAVRVRRQRAARDRRRRAGRAAARPRRCSSSACRSISASRRPATRTRRTPGSTPARSSAA